MQPVGIKGLSCMVCGKVWMEGETESTCPGCGMEGILDVLYHEPAVKGRELQQLLAQNNDYSMWRYAMMLPLPPDAELPPLPTGYTPMFRSESLQRELGIDLLWIKDEGRNPSASLKDRASAVAVVRAQAQGFSVVACSSTGNAATSLSGMAAAKGLSSFIFIPKQAPKAKQTQLKIYGSHVFIVEGDYAAAFDVSAAAIQRFGWYDRNCAINPYLVEGKKTVAWEMAEQTGWNPPHTVFVAVGDGCTISAVYKGFAECYDLQLIPAIPKIVGVQAAGASPIYRAWKENRPMLPQAAKTIADSISVGHPKNHLKALKAIALSGGEMITVTDEEILQAQALLARKAGVFGEPAGVAGFAGLLKHVRDSSPPSSDRSYGIIITGHGLKDIDAAARYPGSLHRVSADPSQAFEIIEKLLPSAT